MSLADIDTIDRLLTERSRADAGKPALLAPNRSPISYQALAEQLPMVARSLRTAGVRRNDSVAVVLSDGPELAAAFLTFSACARFAPLNPGYGTRDFEFYLDDLKARAVVVAANHDSPVRAVARSRNIPLLELTVRPGAPAGMFELRHDDAPVPDEPVAPEDAQPDDVALVLHTSGTTSRPKLVPLSHRNLCQSARNIAGTLQLIPGDRALSVMPLFHTHGLIGVLLSSIMAGASVICTPGFDVSRFLELLPEWQPTWYSAVPTMHLAIVDSARKQGLSKIRSSLRVIRSTSSALPAKVMQELEAIFDAPVIESYGMTEASQITSNLLPPGQRKPGCVGQATGQEVAIVDEQGRIRPRGETGEIVIRGPNVTRGYENNPDANTAAFAHGWFHTGDYGRLDHDGYLFICGRIKEIINRGGDKISPREIDDALQEHPGVLHAVAFAIPHPTLGEDVAAAVVARDGSHLEEAELRNYLGRLLSPSKIPRRLILVKDLPKGPTGKVQRIGLAARLAAELSTTFEPPAPGLETTIAETIQQTLRRAPVGRHENFFAAGGDSITATQVLVRLRELLGIEIQPMTFFNHPTVAQLAVELTHPRNTEIDRLATELAKLSVDDAAQVLREIEAIEA